MLSVPSLFPNHQKRPLPVDDNIDVTLEKAEEQLTRLRRKKGDLENHLSELITRKKILQMHVWQLMPPPPSSQVQPLALNSLNIQVTAPSITFPLPTLPSLPAAQSSASQSVPPTYNAVRSQILGELGTVKAKLQALVTDYLANVEMHATGVAPKNWAETVNVLYEISQSYTFLRESLQRLPTQDPEWKALNSWCFYLQKFLPFQMMPAVPTTHVLSLLPVTTENNCPIFHTIHVYREVSPDFFIEDILLTTYYGCHLIFPNTEINRHVGAFLQEIYRSDMKVVLFIENQQSPLQKSLWQTTLQELLSAPTVWSKPQHSISLKEMLLPCPFFQFPGVSPSVHYSKDHWILFNQLVKTTYHYLASMNEQDYHERGSIAKLAAEKLLQKVPSAHLFDSINALVQIALSYSKEELTLPFPVQIMCYKIEVKTPFFPISILFRTIFKDLNLPVNALEVYYPRYFKHLRMAHACFSKRSDIAEYLKPNPLEGNEEIDPVIEFSLRCPQTQCEKSSTYSSFKEFIQLAILKKEIYYSAIILHLGSRPSFTAAKRMIQAVQVVWAQASLANAFQFSLATENHPVKPLLLKSCRLITDVLGWESPFGRTLSQNPNLQQIVTEIKTQQTTPAT